MINALFYSFAKKVNSTAQPGTGITVQVDLKEETDILSPVLIISPATGITTPYQWNYCYIATFSRYYYIENWNWKNGLWECMLKVDVLASYKAAIGSSSQYVLRSASSYNGDVQDKFYPVTSAISRQSYSLGISSRAKTIDQGCFILGVIGASLGVGSVIYYQLTRQQLDALIGQLLSSITWAGASDISEELQKELFNPFQYIVSCIWLPYTAGNFTLVSEVKLGYWTFTQSCYRLDVDNTLPCYNAVIYGVQASNIPLHPQITRGRYLTGPDYSKYYLRLSGYGVIELPNDLITLNQGFSIVESRDLITGESTVSIYVGVGNGRTTTPMIVVHGRYGVQIQLAQSTTDVLGAATSAISGLIGGISNIATGNLLGGITSMAGGIGDAVLSSMPNIQTSGMNGSFLATLEMVDPTQSAINPVDTIECVFKYIADEDNTHFGKPLCAQRTLSTLSGYIQCANAEVAITGSSAEQDEVNGYLNSGFFYE